METERLVVTFGENQVAEVKQKGFTYYYPLTSLYFIVKKLVKEGWLPEKTTIEPETVEPQKVFNFYRPGPVLAREIKQFQTK